MIAVLKSAICADLAFAESFGVTACTREQAAVPRASTACLCFAESAWYLAELCANWVVSVQRDPGVTTTVKLVGTDVAELPALSVAVVVRLLFPMLKEYAGAVIGWHAVAIPEGASEDVHAIVTIWSTVYEAG